MKADYNIFMSAFSFAPPFFGLTARRKYGILLQIILKTMTGTGKSRETSFGRESPLTAARAVANARYIAPPNSRRRERILLASIGGVRRYRTRQAAWPNTSCNLSGTAEFSVSRNILRRFFCCTYIHRRLRATCGKIASVMYEHVHSRRQLAACCPSTPRLYVQRI